MAFLSSPTNLRIEFNIDDLSYGVLQKGDRVDVIAIIRKTTGSESKTVIRGAFVVAQEYEGGNVVLTLWVSGLQRIQASFYRELRPVLTEQL